MVNYKKIAQAIVLFVIGFNIIQLHIILTIVGLVLLYMSMKTLREYDKTTSLLKPLIISLGVVEVANPVIYLALGLFSNYTNLSTEQQMSMITTSSTIIQALSSLIIIYLIYQFFTIIANLCGHLDKDLCKKMKICRNLSIIYSVLGSIYTLITFTIAANEQYYVLMTVATVMAVVISIFGLVIMILQIIVVVKAYKLFNNYVPIMPAMPVSYPEMQAQMPNETPIEIQENPQTETE